MSEATAEQLASKMPPGYFSMRLEDNVNRFIEKISNEKKGLKKGELVHLLKYAIKYPDVDNFPTLAKFNDFYELISDNKDTFVSLTVEVLIERGQEIAESKKPKFVKED